MASDPLNAAWEQAQHKSFEELKAEANRQKALRENLQPMALGKGQYASIFKVGDRLRSELALRLEKPASVSELGSGQVELNELIPAAAFKDLDHALAQALVGTQAETEEGVREEIIYDADEATAAEWAQESGESTPPRRPRLVLHPPAVERTTETPTSAATEVSHLQEEEGGPSAPDH